MGASLSGILRKREKEKEARARVDRKLFLPGEKKGDLLL